MSEQILIRAHCEQLALLEAAVASWKQEERTPWQGREVNDALRLGRHWPEMLRAIEAARWRKAVDKQIDDFNAAGQEAQSYFDRSLALYDSLMELAREHRNLDHRTFDEDQLNGIREEIRLAGKEFVERWPWFTEEMVREAMEDYARGDYISVTEWLNELQGNHPPRDPQTDRRLEPA